jgi:solute carrier family 25 phosphate transporter 23/24/25/41
MSQSTLHFIAGFLSGMVAKAAVSPLDRIKIILQTSNRNDTFGSLVKRIYKQEGFKGFWTGTMANCATQGPQVATKFLSLHIVKQLFSHIQLHRGRLPLIGSIAGILSKTPVYPLEVIYVRKASTTERYQGFLYPGVQIVKEEGFSGLFSGWIPTMVGIIPYQGVHYMISEGLREHYLKSHDNINPLVSGGFGAIATIISQSITFPIDVVRKRMMVVDKNGNKLHNSISDCIQTVIKEKRLFRGLPLSLIQAIPYNAVQNTVFELLMKIL